ncbi:hypothetical protein ACWDSJ_28100 [Nocardia sp. NPDC003482]
MLASPRAHADPDPAPELTGGAAAQQILRYVQDTADATGLKFSDGAAEANFCEAYEPRGPQQILVSYRITGVPPGQTGAAVDRLLTVWESWGWAKDPRSTTTKAAAKTPIQYTFLLKDAGKGDGGLSVMAASPCFPLSSLNQGPQGRVPTEITSTDPRRKFEEHSRFRWAYLALAAVGLGLYLVLVGIGVVRVRRNAPRIARLLYTDMRVGGYSRGKAASLTRIGCVVVVAVWAAVWPVQVALGYGHRLLRGARRKFSSARSNRGEM